MLGEKEPRTILAVVYSDGLAADELLAALGYRLRDAGVAVAGIVQRNSFVRHRTRCDMEVEELASETVLRLSEDRGPAARGCRLDQSALAQATVLLEAALAAAPDLVIVNKFGKMEAAGRGLRDVLGETVQRNIPLIIGVPARNLDAWRVFAAGLADECPVSAPEILAWIAGHGFDVREIIAGARLTPGSCLRGTALSNP